MASSHTEQEQSTGGLKVRARVNVLQQWIISPSENEYLAWNGTRWVSIDHNGLPIRGLIAVLNFGTALAAVAYAAAVGFEVQHG